MPTRSRHTSLRPCFSRLQRGAGVAAVLTALLATTACGSDSPAEDDRAAAAALVEQGINQMQSGDTEQAEESFQRALRLDDEQYRALYNQGVIDQQGDRTEEAIDHYEDVLDIAPDDGPTLYNLGILTEGKDLTKAVELYRRAVEAQPDYAATHMRLGFALAHLGRTDEAEGHLAQGIKLDPAMEDVEAPVYD